MKQAIFQLANDADSIAAEIGKTPLPIPITESDREQVNTWRTLGSKLGQFSIEIRALAAGLK